MSRACTSGRPALIMVANWRVNTTTSRVLMPAPSFGSLSSVGACRTCTTTMRFFRRWAMTSSRLGRSILSLTSSPLRVRAVYWKTGMAQVLLTAPSGGALFWTPRAAGARPDLRLLVRREHVDDAVDALHRRVRVQGGEHQVAGFRDGQRRPDRLEVAHLADEYDVRVLPQRVLERRREARGVGADLALVDD